MAAARKEIAEKLRAIRVAMTDAMLLIEAHPNRAQLAPNAIMTIDHVRHTVDGIAERFKVSVLLLCALYLPTANLSCYYRCMYDASWTPKTALTKVSNCYFLGLHYMHRRHPRPGGNPLRTYLWFCHLPGLRNSIPTRSTSQSTTAMSVVWSYVLG
jgi:hypothetical protein